MNEIPIQPQSDVYATYRRLSYQPWHAIAEYVDNSTHNYLQHRAELEAVESPDFPVTVEIYYDEPSDTLKIIDNAYGMNIPELTRAMQLNKPPEDRTGRSEFGMGLKMASCWLGRRWRVVTKQLNSDQVLTAEIDIDYIEKNAPSSIPITITKDPDPSVHYTRVEIEGVYRKFKGRTIGKIKTHLASMYRRDIAAKTLDLVWDRESLTWLEDEPYEELRPDGQRTTWAKEIEFPVMGLIARGRVKIIIPGNAKRAGIHVFRRGRLIQGGEGEGWKPPEIYGATNDYQGKRVVVELDLDDWDVSMTKDRIDWSGALEQELIEHLQSQIADYITKSRGIRDNSDLQARDARVLADTLIESLAGEDMEVALDIVEIEDPTPSTPKETRDEFERFAAAAGEPIVVPVGTARLPEIKAYFTASLSENDPYVAFDFPDSTSAHVVVNMNHPFVTDVIGSNDEALQRYILVLYADSLVERELFRKGKETVPISAHRRLKDHFLRHIKPPS